MKDDVAPPTIRGVRKLECFCYLIVKTAWSHFHSSGEGTSVWQTDGQTDRRTELPWLVIQRSALQAMQPHCKNDNQMSYGNIQGWARDDEARDQAVNEMLALPAEIRHCYFLRHDRNVQVDVVLIAAVQVSLFFHAHYLLMWMWLLTIGLIRSQSIPVCYMCM